MILSGFPVVRAMELFFYHALVPSFHDVLTSFSLNYGCFYLYTFIAVGFIKQVWRRSFWGTCIFLLHFKKQLSDIYARAVQCLDVHSKHSGICVCWQRWHGFNIACHETILCIAFWGDANIRTHPCFLGNRLHVSVFH